MWITLFGVRVLLHYICKTKAKIMNSTNYTPGPWKAGIKTKRHGTPYTEVLSTATENGISLSICGPVALIPGHHESEETDANATLIAAAPELLEALNDVLDHCERYFPAFGTIGGKENEIVEKAKAALQKATL